MRRLIIWRIDVRTNLAWEIICKSHSRGKRKDVSRDVDHAKTSARSAPAGTGDRNERFFSNLWSRLSVNDLTGQGRIFVTPDAH
jgi:hypothetical protein